LDKIETPFFGAP